jgi:hypothetical protein
MVPVCASAEGSDLSRFFKTWAAIAVVLFALAASDMTAQTTGVALPAKISDPSPDAVSSRTWEFGPFAQGGTGVGDRFNYQFFSLGFQAGRNLTPIIHAGPFTGRFEMDVNIMPLWQAYTPSPYTVVTTTPSGTETQHYGGGVFRGVSVTPVTFRWNFRPASRRFMPWFQAAAGCIYTTHKFPPDLEVPKGTPGGTSVFNFSPQGGIGFHYFKRQDRFKDRSFDLGLNAIHISSASLGDRNPGVNASLWVQIGYTWWK